jgi:hypothetical protein
MGQRSVSHSDWLTKLVITLLSSGGVSDEVLTLVRPVCKVKVRENSTGMFPSMRMRTVSLAPLPHSFPPSIIPSTAPFLPLLLLM